MAQRFGLSLALAWALTLLLIGCGPERVGGLQANSESSESASPCCSEHGVKSETLPGDSLLQLRSTWTDQSGSPRRLADWHGHPVLIAMVFTHCAYACPRLVSDIQAIEAALSAAEREQLRIVLVSFDHVRDVPERLASWAKERRLGSRYTLLHGEESSIREIAAVLGIQYRPAGDTGDFAHSNRITLLDRSGRAIQHADGLGADTTNLTRALRGELARR